MKTRKKSTFSRLKKGLLAFVIPAALCSQIAQAQTVVLNPATHGGFEVGTGSLTDNGWTQVSAASNDTWYTGTGLTANGYSFPSTTRCAYISKDAGGTTWSYQTTVSPNAAHIYRDVTVPAGETQVTLSFKYQLLGTNNTKLMVYVCPNNAIPTTTEPQSNGGTVSNNGWGAGTGVPLLLFSAATPNTSTTTQTFTAPIPQSFLNNCNSSRTFRLVFTSFRNSSGTSNLPPPAIDSIQIISRVPVSQAPGIFTINNTLPTSGTNFNNFTDAITWVNAVAECGLTNPITFNVSAGQTFDENTPYITASATASKPIIFQKSGAGANPVIRPTGAYGGYQPTTSNPGTQDFGICLHGADYITFDGIDITSNNVSQTISVEYGYLVRNASSSNGSNNNTIKNTTIILDRTSYLFGGTTTGTRGIVQSTNQTSGGGVSVTSPNGTNNNNSYYNFTIGNVNQGILLYGSSGTMPDLNTKIGTLTPGTFNYIGRTGVPNDIGNSTTAALGINAQFQNDVSITNNIIQNITSISSTVDGILIGFPSGAFNGSGGLNNEIGNNQVSFLKLASTTSTSSITGIRVQHDNAGTLGAIAFKIYNNAISNLSSNYTGAPTAARVIKGLWLQAGAPTNPVGVQYEIVNNTIVIDGSSSPNLSNIVFENTFGSSILKLRNNLFYNMTTDQPLASHYVLGITGATSVIGTTGSLSNYNDLFYLNPLGGFLSFNNNITTLAGWQSTFNVDANSISANPKLNSATLLYPLASSPLIAGGPTLGPPYNRDIMNALRASGNCTIGAFEKAGDIVAPFISDTLIMGVNSTSNRILPGLLKVNDDGGMVDNTPGKAPRIYFKKSTDANAFGANNSSFNGWKWVEATNTSSPYDFTIDYALLTSPVTTHNVIQYFFVAQDTVAIPNIAASPASGFVGTSVGTISSAPTTPKSYVIYNTPAAYIGSTATQPVTSTVMQGGANYAIIRIEVQTAPTGDSAYVTEMNFNSNTVTDLNNISAAKVWYTGTDGNFSPYAAGNKQFGQTYTTPAGSGALGNFGFTGAQITPPNSTVYFWLTYDIKTSAIIGDQVDASVVSLTYNGGSQIPTLLSPAGTRTVKQAYCIPVPSSSNRHLSNVNFNTLNNNTGTTPFTAPFYMNYAPVGTATTTVKRGQTYTLSVTQASAQVSAVAYIDYNDNGVFDANETINIAPFAGNSGVATTMAVTIPCDAVVSSEIRMRVISYFTGSPWSSNCIGSNGEAQDYTISIIDGIADYVSSSAIQFSGSVAPSATAKVMMKLPIISTGCGTVYLTEMRCNTEKTQNPTANIAFAKLYSTGRSNTFSTAELIASVGSPSGSFLFTGFSDSLYSNPGDTNFYWIAYDMTPTANLNDTIDIRIDSLTAAGRTNLIPSNGNPVQYQLVKANNTYLSSTVIHPTGSRVVRVRQSFTPVLRVRIIGTNTGAPLRLTQLNFNPAGGGNDVANIASARVFYTGNSATFSNANQFGATYTAGTNVTGNQWNPFNIAGIQELNSDTNYFWLAYDIQSSASSIDSVDADLTSFTLGVATIVPTSSSVAGALPINTNYCFMGPSGQNFSSSQPANSFEELTNFQFGTINNTSTCSQTGGFGSITGQYADYSDIVAPAVVQAGDTVRISMTGVSNCNQPGNNNQQMSFVVMIDWNQNGVFDLPAEAAYRSPASNSVRTYTDKIFVPCTALPGNTRMRVIFGTGSNAANALLLGTTCGNTSTSVYIYGETEDYTITVQNNPVTTVLRSFVQQTGAAGKGVNDIPVLRIAVKPKGCGPLMNAMHFSLPSNVLASDISSVKLYSTGTSNVFNTTNLLGTVTPSANMQFTGLTTALTNNTLTDSNYFWLTYDVPLSAVTNDTLDIRLDSMNIGGTIYNTTATGNPSGYRLIGSRMAYSGVTVINSDTSSVAVGTLGKQILRVKVSGTNTNGPVQITSLSFNVNGSGNNLINVDSARVYFTGSSATFSTVTPFGTAYSAAPAAWGSFTITGNATATTIDNYFWLVYDIKSTATIYDSVDAEFTGLTFDGIAQPYSGPVPSGSSKIRGNYCTTTHAGTNSSYYILTNVTIGGVSTNTGNTRTIPFYIDNTGTAVRNVSKGTNPMSVTINDLASAGNVGGYTYIYIDYDQNGDFAGPNEFVTSVATPFAPLFTGITNFTYTIPCNVKAGITRMRVTTSLSATAPSICGLSTVQGETEDYTINIQENPLTFTSAIASQPTGTAAQGANNQLIMNIKVTTTGCGTPTLTNMYFNTSGSTNPATDILFARLYKTGTSPIFSTANLIGSVATPVGAFDFTGSSINDNLVIFEENNYWLAYDIAGSAVNNDTVDVRVDSIMVMGARRIPTPTAPTGFKKILAPLNILDITASYPSGDRVGQGTTNFPALCIRVIANSSGASVPVTAFNLNTNGGGADINNLNSASMYYTGNSKDFSTAAQFGSTYTAGSNITGTDWLPYTISGYQELVPDTNYFWLTYNVKSNATLGDAVDAEVPSMVISAVSQPVNNPAPAGNALVRQEYCFSAGSTVFGCIDTVVAGTLFNASGQTGCSSYTNYPKTGTWTTSVNAGSTLPIRLTFTSPTRVSAFIDLNKNGIFEPGEEYVLASTYVPSISTSIFIPASATLGETRMRIRTFGGQTQGGTDRACSNWNQSESEDYTITILPALPQTTYTWNNAGTSDFTAPSNWTPARNSASPNDILVFNSPATPLNITNVFTQTLSSLEVTQATIVNMNASGNAVIKIIGTLTLNDSARINGNNQITFEIGESIGTTGAIAAGTASGLNTKIKRWMNPNNSSNFVFPFRTAKGSRNVMLSYSFAPLAYGSITASFIPAKALGNFGFPMYEPGIAADVNKTCNEGYWTLTPDDGLSGGIYTGTFTMDSIAFLPNPSASAIINRPDAFSAWIPNGNHTGVSVTNATVMSSRNSMQNFGEFALAADSTQNPLPVTLTSFTAAADKAGALVQWNTSSEVNNSGFDLERSVDGRSFEKVTFVKGNGTSALAHKYAYNDENAFTNTTSNILYYRLKQIDFDGRTTYSKVVRVASYMQQAGAVSVYPNPFEDNYTVTVDLQNDAEVEFVMTNIQGKTIATETVSAVKGNNNLPVTRFANLEAGVYFLRITVGGESQVIKMIKK